MVECVGVLGLDIKTGLECITVKAKATLLCTGGGMRILSRQLQAREVDWRRHSYRRIGQGWSSIDMEFPMFLPGCFPRPKAVMGVNTPFKLCWSGFIHGYLYNRHGERLIATWDPERMERSTRDIIAIGIATEILEGERQSAWWGIRLAETYARQSW